MVQKSTDIAKIISLIFKSLAILNFRNNIKKIEDINVNPPNKS